MPLLRRRSIALMSHATRCFGLCSREASRVKKLQRYRRTVLVQYFAAREAEQDEEFVNTLLVLLAQLNALIEQLVHINIEVPLAIELPARTIESFSDAMCWQRFRMRKPDLHRLKTVLSIPRMVTLPNGSRITGEEILLFSLNRFTTCGWIHDLIPVYGRDASQWTRAFHWFIRYMIANYAYLLTDMLQFWKPYIPLLAERIRQKLHDKAGIYFPPGTFRIFGFIDCTVIASLRPGAGL